MLRVLVGGFEGEGREGREGLIWIVGSESVDEIAACLDFHYVSSDWRSWRSSGGRTGCFVRVVVGWGAFDHLEIVAVWIKISELVLPIQDGDLES